MRSFPQRPSPQRCIEDMRIVLFYKTIVNVGGAERLLVKEWEYLRRFGHSVKILTYRVTSEALYSDDAELRADLVVCGNNPLIAMIRAALFLRRFNCDVVIVSSGFIDIFLINLFCKFNYVIHSHHPASMTTVDDVKYSFLHRRKFDYICGRNYSSHVFREVKASLRWWSWRRRFILELRALLSHAGVRRARFGLVLSDYGKEEFEFMWGIPAHNVQGAFDPDAFERYDRVDRIEVPINIKNVILTVTRLDADKRIDRVMGAVRKVLDEEPDSLYVVVGNGSEYENLDALRTRLGIADRCRLLGYVDEETLKRWYKTCDVFVTMDWTDFQGLAAFEALAAGCPVVVSSEVDCNEDLVRAGYLTGVRPESEDIADGILGALRSSNRAPVEKLREILAAYTWNSYFRKIERLLLENVVPERSRAHARQPVI